MMTVRLAKKILGHPLAYPPHKRAEAARRYFQFNYDTEAGSRAAIFWVRGNSSGAARRAERVLARRYGDDASRWLPGNGPAPSVYGHVVLKHVMTPRLRSDRAAIAYWQRTSTPPQPRRT